jgi:hypothetical protein
MAALHLPFSPTPGLPRKPRMNSRAGGRFPAIMSPGPSGAAADPPHSWHEEAAIHRGSSGLPNSSVRGVWATGQRSRPPAWDLKESKKFSHQPWASWQVFWVGYGSFRSFRPLQRVSSSEIGRPFKCAVCACLRGW